jgi:hypothetical protein
MDFYNALQGKGFPVDALAKARKVLSSRSSDVRLRFVPGLAEDMRALGEAFEEIDRRISVLAAVVLRKHYWPDAAVHTAQLRALMEMGAEPAAVGRIGTHGETCGCEACMYGRIAGL